MHFDPANEHLVISSSQMSHKKDFYICYSHQFYEYNYTEVVIENNVNLRTLLNSKVLPTKGYELVNIGDGNSE